MSAEKRARSALPEQSSSAQRGSMRARQMHALALSLRDATAGFEFVDPRLLNAVVARVDEILGLEFRERLASTLIEDQALGENLLRWLDTRRLYSPWSVRSISTHRKWKLLFQASRNGFEAADFHRCCDARGPTVTIAKSGENLFGGFTSVPWSSRSRWEDDSASWLYSLVGPTGPAIKFPVTGEGRPAVCHYAGHGPVFYGLGIVSNCNKNKNSASKLLGDLYNDRVRGKYPLTGRWEFQVDDYEVFGWE